MYKNRKFWIGLFLSSVCIAGLFTYTDWNRSFQYFSKINYIYIIPFMISAVLVQFLMGYRYFLLLDKNIPLRKAVRISILSNSANMILPVRGGDILKGYLSKEASSLGYFHFIVRIVFERSLDLGFAFAAGMIALGSLYWNDIKLGFQSYKFSSEFPSELPSKLPGGFSSGFFILSLLLCLCIPLGLFLIRTRLEFLLGLIKKIAKPFAKLHFLKTILTTELYSLRDCLAWKKLYLPLIISILIWFGGHVLSLFFAAQMQNIEISYSGMLLLLFAVAMAFLIPSAPSGIGVLHVSLSSAMHLLNFPIEQAVAYAVVFHLCSFAAIGSLGLCFLFLRTP